VALRFVPGPVILSSSCRVAAPDSAASQGGESQDPKEDDLAAEENRQERLLEKPYPPVSANMATGKSPTKFTKWLFKWENKRKDLEVPPRHRNADPARSGESGAVTEKQKKYHWEIPSLSSARDAIYISVLYCTVVHAMKCHVQGCMDAWMDVSSFNIFILTTTGLPDRKTKGLHTSHRIGPISAM